MTLRVIAAGRTLSGKTEWLWRRYLRRHRRLLIVDTIGEWSTSRSAGEDVIHASGAEDVRAALADVAVMSPHEWTIVADVDREELVTLTDLIAPRRIDASPVPALGGLAIYIDEVDLMVPVADNRLAGLWRRGRHIGISVYAATQRPASVSKEVSAMVDIYGVLALDEVRDVEYLRQRFGRARADEGLVWARSAPYRVAAYGQADWWRLPPEPD